MKVRVVTKEIEREFTFEDLNLTPQASDAEVIAATERGLETVLDNHVVTREEDRLLVSPSPVFG